VVCPRVGPRSRARSSTTRVAPPVRRTRRDGSAQSRPNQLRTSRWRGTGDNLADARESDRARRGRLRPHPSPTPRQSGRLARPGSRAENDRWSAHSCAHLHSSAPSSAGERPKCAAYRRAQPRYVATVFGRQPRSSRPSRILSCNAPMTSLPSSRHTDHPWHSHDRMPRLDQGSPRRSRQRHGRLRPTTPPPLWSSGALPRSGFVQRRFCDTARGRLHDGWRLTT
jgi:hypothetical protein